MAVKNVLKSFRFTTEEWLSLESNAKSKEMTIRDYIIHMNKNSTGIIDKEGLKILFKNMFEPEFAKRMIGRYCGH